MAAANYMTANALIVKLFSVVFSYTKLGASAGMIVGPIVAGALYINVLFFLTLQGLMAQLWDIQISPRKKFLFPHVWSCSIRRKCNESNKTKHWESQHFVLGEILSSE